MAVGNIYKLAIQGQLNPEGDPNINTFYYLETQNGGTDDEVELLNSWTGLLEVLYAGCLSVDYSIITRSAYRVFPTSGVLHTQVSTQNGTQAGGRMPENVSIVLSRRANVAGRVGRGRIFLPGVPTSFIDDSSISTAAQNAIDPFANAYMQLIASGLYQFIPVIFNRRTPLASSFWNPITFYKINRVVREQRRREYGVRIHPSKKAAVAAARTVEPTMSAQIEEFANRWKSGERPLYTPVSKPNLAPSPAEVVASKKTKPEK